MSIFENLFKKKMVDGTSKTLKIGDNKPKKYVKLKDEFGRDLTIEKEMWVEEFLKPALKANWNNIEVLYGIVLDAFNNDIFADVKDAALRIYNLDKDKEKGTNFLGIYYANTNMYDEAKSIYEKYIENEKPSEIIFSNYGVVLEKEGRQAEAQKYFWKSLEINPNMQNPLNKIIEFSKNKSDEEYYKSLYKISTFPNSWRSKLLKANYEIKLGNIETALVDISKSLEESNYNSESLTAALAIYGNNKKYNEIENNILPYFEPMKHGPYATLNILKYLKISEKYNDALNILRYSSSFNWNEFTNDFIKHEEEFIAMKKKFESYDIQDENNNVLLINKPIWFKNFNNPNWALNQDTRKKPSLLILPITNIGEVSTDLPRKLSIAIPLFLNDKLHFDSDLQYQFAMTYNNDGITVPKKHYDTEYIHFIKDKNPNLDYILSGNIFSKWNGKENIYEIEMYVYDTNVSAKTTLLRELVKENTVATLLPMLLNNLNLFFNKLINHQALKDSDVQHILSKPDKLKFLLDLDKYNKNRSWSYSKYINEYIDTIIESSDDDTRFELVSLLHEISQTQQQLLGKNKAAIYNLLKNGFFGSPKSERLLPIIFNIYSDEKNYNNFMGTLHEENPEYIEWINKFLDLKEEPENIPEEIIGGQL